MGLSDAVSGTGDGWVMSVGRALSSRGAAEAVSSCGDACTFELISVSVTWARGGGNLSGIEVVTASLNDVTDEGLSGMDVGVTDILVFGASEVLRSADWVA